MRTILHFQDKSKVKPCDTCGGGNDENLIATCRKCNIARAHPYDSLSLSLLMCVCVQEHMYLYLYVHAVWLIYLTVNQQVNRMSS